MTVFSDTTNTLVGMVPVVVAAGVIKHVANSTAPKRTVRIIRKSKLIKPIERKGMNSMTWQLKAQLTNKKQALEIKDDLEHSPNYGKGRVKLELNKYHGITYYHVLGAKPANSLPVLSKHVYRSKSGAYSHRKTRSSKRVY